MSFSRRLSLFLCCSAALAQAQSTASNNPNSAAPAPATKPQADRVEHLDAVVVSAGPDPKSAFDLAQGTAVLAGDDLRRAIQATLGDTLAQTPGVSSTSYGPGASRPVIRGLGGDRVRVLDNGIGALDASNVSPDHAVALEPLFASRIEVLRGPSTLLYGSSAVGGAVNVIDNAIPETAPDGQPHGALELRGGGAADERAGVLSLEGGANGFAAHVNALKQKFGDTRIPGVARIDAEAPAGQPRGTLPGTAIDTFSGSVGGSVFWQTGHAGAAVTHYETEYGVPTDEPGLGIRMRQTRFDFSADVTQPFGIFRGAQARLGLGRYTHAEITDGTTIHTTFDNNAAEARLELPHAAIGPFSGTVGLQGTRSDFSAAGEEVVTPPSLTQTGALFALEEAKLGEKTTLQLGGRLERQTIALGEVDPALPALPGYAAHSRQRQRFTGASGSLGLVFYPAKDWSVALAFAYTERLPTTQELFSNGPHGGTGAYEIGTTGLPNERSLGADLSVRRRAGFVTGSLGVFVNRFRDYIFEAELPAAAVPAANNPEGLTPFQFVARDARFRGGEAELLLHLLEGNTQRLHLELKADIVRAEQTATGEPLPRIPPVHYGARLSYASGRWSAGVELRHARPQERVAATESPTPGYTLVNADLGYTLAAGRVGYELFLRGRNLGDAEAREHTSFLKEFAPLPGRGVSAGVRLSF
jgi:iron complex outermembrane receptor protein